MVAILPGTLRDGNQAPLSRGSKRCSGACPKGRRNNPAYTGKPLSAVPSRPSTGVQPRACGETSGGRGYCSDRQQGTGTTPLTRGNLLQRDAVELVVGYNPAYTGNPDGRRTTRRYNPAYTGETLVVARAAREPTGTTPRVRGIGLARRRCRWEQPRIHGGERQTCHSHTANNPAYAGKPGIPLGGSGLAGVQPRACGETSKARNETRGSGTTPRVRGNPTVLRASALSLGYNPARAGKPVNSRP
jgi:hypothetical protein